MSTTARQGDSSTPMPHAGAGGAEQISTATVTEVISDLDKRARAVYEAVRAAIAHLLADLPQRGRVAVGGDGLADRLVHRASTFVEAADGLGDRFGDVCAGAWGRRR